MGKKKKKKHKHNKKLHTAVIETNNNENNINDPENEEDSSSEIFDINAAEKFILKFILIITLFIIFLPNDVMNTISIFINNILP